MLGLGGGLLIGCGDTGGSESSCHGPCGACPANFPSTEFDYLGYGNALNLNDGTPGSGANYMQIYVR